MSDSKDISLVPPKSAQNNAKKVLKWKEEHGSEVKGMTSVGWTRARQLASGEELSANVVKRMASFARHRKNASVDPKYKNEPWKDRGYVAWLGWGGDSGINWAIKKSERLKRKASIKSVRAQLGVAEQSLDESAAGNLQRICDLAKMIQEQLSGHEMEAWILDKISTSKDDLEDVFDCMKYHEC